MHQAVMHRDKWPSIEIALAGILTSKPLSTRPQPIVETKTNPWIVLILWMILALKLGNLVVNSKNRL